MFRVQFCDVQIVSAICHSVGISFDCNDLYGNKKLATDETDFTDFHRLFVFFLVISFP
jgi:hypothetical protein